MSLRDRLNASPYAREPKRSDPPMPAVLEPVRFSLIMIVAVITTLTATCVGGVACGAMIAKAQPARVTQASERGFDPRGVGSTPTTRIDPGARSEALGSDPSGDGATPSPGITLADAMLAWLSLPYQRPDGTHPFVAHCRQRRGGCEAYARRYALLFDTYAERARIDPFLLAAVALHESALNEDAIGGVGETGVMQIHPHSRIASWVRRWCRTSPSDCDAIHVQAGASVLGSAIRSCGNEADGLGLYNRGACGETSYSRAVLALRDRLRGGS